MAITYRIDPSTRTLHTTCAGAVMLPDVFAHFDALQRDPLAYGPLDVVLDFTHVTTLPDAAQLRTVAARIGEAPLVFGACAIAAASDALFGIARMFEVFAEGQFRAVRVFRELGQAQAWLEAQQQARGASG